MSTMTLQSTIIGYPILSSQRHNLVLPAWWALWLLWWPLTDAAMFHCVYGYLQSFFLFPGIVPLLYSVGNKTYYYYYYYYYYYKGNIKAPHLGPFVREIQWWPLDNPHPHTPTPPHPHPHPTPPHPFPNQRASNEESVSMIWRIIHR